MNNHVVRYGIYPPTEPLKDPNPSSYLSNDKSSASIRMDMMKIILDELQSELDPDKALKIYNKIITKVISHFKLGE